MTYEVFDRRYSLIIGRPSKTIVQSIPTSIAKRAVTTPQLLSATEVPYADGSTIPRYLAATNLINNSLGDISKGVRVDYRTIPDQFIEIRDLSMKAKISYKKSGAKGGNQFSTIALDNLSEETKNSIRVNDLIFLRAGYRIDMGNNNVDYNDLPLILSAQITKVETKRDGNSGTTTTHIVCGDNVLPKKNIKISKSWPPNTVKKKVLDDVLAVAQSNFIPIGKVQGELEAFFSPLQETYPNGYSIAGNLFEEIQKFCDSVDYKFYTVLGKMYVEPKGSAKTYETFLLEPTTLKEPIQLHSDSSNKKSGEKGSNSGIVAKLFLNGRILTNMAVDIRYGNTDWWGTYPIESITHDLDFEGNTWNTTVKTVAL